MAPKKEVEETPESIPDEEEMEVDEDEDDDIEGMMEDGMDLSAVLTTEDGDTVCSALVDINESMGEVARQIGITNKLLLKMLSKMK